MDSLLVISNEPGLAETLTSELPECAITSVRLEQAAQSVHTQEFRLILIDEDSSPRVTLPEVKAPVIRLTRPVRLNALLYSIHEQLQSKSGSVREELPLCPGYCFSPMERVLRATDSDARIALTEKEVELLLCLLEQKDKTVPRDVLLKRVWGYSDDIATHTLETHIYRLRGKLRQASNSIDIVFSDEGGYRLTLLS